MDKEPFPSKDVVISTIKKTCAEISKRVKSERIPTAYVNANDYLLSNNLKLDKIKPDAFKDVKGYKIAIFVGSGEFLSFLPEVPTDIVILVDKNPFLKEWEDRIIDNPECINPENYARIILNSQIGIEASKAEDGANTYEGLYRNKQEFGELHFLSSDKRAKECLEALKAKPAIPLCIDLTNESAMQELGNVLKDLGAVITFGNFTNVWEHTGDKLEKTLSLLPFHDKAQIIASSMAYQYDTRPRASGVLQGLREYIDYAKDSNYQLSKNKRKHSFSVN